MDLHEIFREVSQADEQMIKFWWQSRSQIRIHIVTLVRCALAEVCSVPVLLNYLNINICFECSNFTLRHHYVAMLAWYIL